jgi:hypothetical protein
MYITTEVRINNNHCIQQAAISSVVLSMGDEMMKIGEGSRPNLRKYAKEAASELLANKEKAYKTVERWFRHYLQYGETPTETSKWKKVASVGGTRRLWLQSDTDALKAIVDARPGLFLDEIQDKLEAATQVRWSSTIVWDKIREELKYSLQRVSEKALEQDEFERLDYQLALEAAVESPDQLVFIDESQKGRNASRRLRWWSPRGRSPVRTEAFDYEPKKRYTLLAACDVNGFIEEACDIVLRGNSTQEEMANPTIGTVGTERVELWIEECLVPILGDYSRGEPRSIVVMDNATVHHSQKIQDLVRSTGAILLYLSPYSPDFNPIELMFNEYKKTLRRFELAQWQDCKLYPQPWLEPSFAIAVCQDARVSLLQKRRKRSAW